MRYLLKKIKSVEFAAVSGIVIFYVILGRMGIGCPIRFFTGISCAGCGMSRAWDALLHMDVAQAFYFHPLFWLPPVCALVWLFSEKIPERIYRGFWWLCAALFLIVYVVRLANPLDSVVTVDLQSGYIFRMIKYILSFFPQ